MSMRNIKDVAGGMKKKSVYTLEENKKSALFISQKFLASLANEGFFSGPIADGLTPELAATLELRFIRFGAKNPIMLTPVGKLCLAHIEDFIESTFALKAKENHQLSKFDVIAMISRYEGVKDE